MHGRPLLAAMLHLPTEVDDTLRAYLSARQMLEKVAKEARVSRVEYSGIIFEPKPYSEDMPRGVPSAVEPYLDSKQHLIVNVPPVVMFKAKCFKPAKLCAVYELIDGKRADDVTYSTPSTVRHHGPIGAANFDFGTEEEFKDQLL